MKITLISCLLLFMTFGMLGWQTNGYIAQLWNWIKLIFNFTIIVTWKHQSEFYDEDVEFYHDMGGFRSRIKVALLQSIEDNI
jgi:hypothetical protein